MCIYMCIRVKTRASKQRWVISSSCLILPPSVTPNVCVHTHTHTHVYVCAVMQSPAARWMHPVSQKDIQSSAHQQERRLSSRAPPCLLSSATKQSQTLSTCSPWKHETSSIQQSVSDALCARHSYKAAKNETSNYVIWLSITALNNREWWWAKDLMTLL